MANKETEPTKVSDSQRLPLTAEQRTICVDCVRLAIEETDRCWPTSLLWEAAADFRKKLIDLLELLLTDRSEPEITLSRVQMKTLREAVTDAGQRMHNMAGTSEPMQTIASSGRFSNAFVNRALNSCVQELLKLEQYLLARLGEFYPPQTSGVVSFDEDPRFISEQ